MKKLEQSLKLPKPHTHSPLTPDFSQNVMNSMILLTFVCNLLVMKIEQKSVRADTPPKGCRGPVFPLQSVAFLIFGNFFSVTSIFQGSSKGN